MSEKATSTEGERRMETLRGCGLRFLPEILSFLVACTQASTSRLYLVYASCERLYPQRTDCTSDTNHDDHIQVIFEILKEISGGHYFLFVGPLMPLFYTCDPSNRLNSSRDLSATFANLVSASMAADYFPSLLFQADAKVQHLDLPFVAGCSSQLHASAPDHPAGSRHDFPTVFRIFER